MDAQSDLPRKLQVARKQYEQNRKSLADRRSALRQIAGDGGKVGHIIRGLARLTAPKELPQLRPQFVEPFLQQASGLIDRVLAEDTTYRQLAIDQLNLRLDLDELERLQAINDDEVANGLFQIPFWEGNASLQSDKALSKAQAGLAKFLQDSTERQTKLAAWSTENAQVPFVTGWEGKQSKHSVQLWEGFTTKELPGEGGAAAFNTRSNVVGGYISREISTYSFEYAKNQLAAQQAPVDARLDSVQKRTEYLQADAGFRERRKISAHQKLTDKLAAVEAAHGPLNYANRLLAIENRAAIDLREAWARLNAVSSGMKLIYGVDSPKLPDLPQAPLKDDDLDFLNQLVKWVRDVGYFLQRIYDNDQDVVMTFSVAELLKRELSTERANRWEFDVGPDRFEGLKLIRLRGVSAVAAVHDAEGPYSCILTAPRTCEVIYGPTSSRRKISLDIDPCWLGRIAPSTSQLQPDVAGTRVLWNASPIGRWKVQLAPGTSAEHVRDVRLNFHIVAQRLA